MKQGIRIIGICSSEKFTMMPTDWKVIKFLTDGVPLYNINSTLIFLTKEELINKINNENRKNKLYKINENWR